MSDEAVDDFDQLRTRHQHWYEWRPRDDGLWEAREDGNGDWFPIPPPPFEMLGLCDRNSA